VQGIVEMNGLRNPRALRVGSELIIPKPIGRGGEVAAARAPEAAPPSPRARPRGQAQVHRAQAERRESRAQVPTASAQAQHERSRTTLRVQRGDTLWSISRRLGVELDELCRWNGIDDPGRHKLLVGARLVVYGERG
jgi:membrane-bound lytic murein transglycosylase D